MSILSFTIKLTSLFAHSTFRRRAARSLSAALSPLALSWIVLQPPFMIFVATAPMSAMANVCCVYYSVETLWYGCIVGHSAPLIVFIFMSSCRIFFSKSIPVDSENRGGLNLISPHLFKYEPYKRLFHVRHAEVVEVMLLLVVGALYNRPQFFRL